MKLHNQQDKLRTAADVTPRKRLAPQITKWVYFITLLAVVIYIIYFIVQKSLTFQLIGVVHMPNDTLYAQRGGSLVSKHAKVGEVLAAGEQLLTFAPVASCEDPRRANRIADLEFDIASAAIELTGLRQAKAIQEGLQKTVPEPNMLRALDVNASLYQSDVASNQSVTLRIAQLQLDIEQQQRAAALLQQQLDALRQTQPSFADPDCFAETITMPYTAAVVDLLLEPGQFARRGDAVGQIRQPAAEPIIIVPIQTELYSRFSIGSSVTVQLPNGQRSAALVTQVSPAQELPIGRELIEVESHNVVAYLSPKQAQDAALWARYDAFTVEIKGGK
jgi:hypothetical protein